MQSTALSGNDDSRYLALKARDARFDGRFFTGVTSTGIYCRPVCSVRTPRRENCCFFQLAAQAEAEGFRPCLRCRPEMAPGAFFPGTSLTWSLQDASTILAVQAARLLDRAAGNASGPVSLAEAALRLGVSERHMRRIFEAHWGISPLQYLQTRRLLSAKQLLTDTHLPIAQVAALSGFNSVRRFNAVFVERYRLQPTALRKSARGPAAETTGGSILIRAAYRPPYDVSHMLGFFHARSLAGVEVVDLQGRSLARTVAVAAHGVTLKGWVQAQFDEERNSVAFRISASLSDALPDVLRRMRALLDLDADPEAIAHGLGNAFPRMEGVRVPGTLDGFELAVRAILGQQITVQAARTIGSRLVAQWGPTIDTPFVGVGRLFPDAATLSGVSGEALGQLGIVRQRQGAILALAQAVSSGALTLSPEADLTPTLARLQDIPGIGSWTAQYIAMRALRWPDAFPAGDVALHKALGILEHASPAQTAERLSQAWQPWRSYAVVRAWHSLSNK
jgi:AraC family transcriptional regulator of adaptative response / DNA-3-methyladenine glycosylase II